MILCNAIKIPTTTASGSASGTFNSTGLCHQIIIKPATGTTMYNFTLTSANSVDIYKLTSESGTVNDLSLIVPFYKVMSWSIDSATADEAFTIYLGVQN